MALLDLLFSLLGSQATAEPCGPSVWCREDVQCSFVQLPVATLGEQTFTVPYAAGPAWPRVLDTDCTISHQPLESQELLSCVSKKLCLCVGVFTLCLVAHVQVLQLARRHYRGWEPGCRSGSDRLPRSGPKPRRVPAPLNHLFILPVF